MRKFFTSAREVNPLVWPFMLTTLAYGLGFALFSSTTGVHDSSLFTAMHGLGATIPVFWGVAALVVLAVGVSFALTNHPKAGKVAGFLGFCLWVFATWCWYLAGGWLLVFAVGTPNVLCWIYLYLSLALRR